MCHFAVGGEHQGVAGQFYASKLLLFLLICFLLMFVSALKFSHYCKNAVRCSVTGVGKIKHGGCVRVSISQTGNFESL